MTRKRRTNNKREETTENPYLLAYPYALFILHPRRHLIPQLSPRPQLSLLLLLNQSATGTAERDTAISTATTLNTEAFTHLTASDSLDDPMGIDEGETCENRALCRLSAGVRFLIKV